MIYHWGGGCGSDASLGKGGSLIKQLTLPKPQGHYYTIVFSAIKGQNQKLSNQTFYTLEPLNFVVVQFFRDFVGTPSPMNLLAL